MKVDISSKPKNGFKPYTVTFFIETAEDASRFHNRVAIVLPEGPCEFIGEVFRRNNGEELPDYHGEI